MIKLTINTRNYKVGKLQGDQKGFSAVEGTLVLVIIVLIGFIGWYVWHTKQSTDKNLAVSSSTTSTSKEQTSTQSSAQTTDQYSGWKTYTLTHEKLTLRYPSTWTESDNSNAATDSTRDNVLFAANDGFHFYVEDGVSNGGDPLSLVSEKAVPVKFLGNNDYLVFYNPHAKNSAGYDTGSASGAVLLMDSSVSNSWPLGKNAVGPNDTDGQINARYISILANYNTPSTNNSLPIAQAQTDTEYKNAKLVIESMHY